jgi:hypothetical protein
MPPKRGVRDRWRALVLSIVSRPLSLAAAGALTDECQRRGPRDRVAFAPLEVLGRILAGIGPWLSSAPADDTERMEVERIVGWMTSSLARMASPRSTEGAWFDAGDQSLVDAAHLVMGLHRSRNQIWDRLTANERNGILKALERTRAIRPWRNNWVLFPALIEAFLAVEGRRHRSADIRQALVRCEEWYVGDGWYADGKSFEANAYNSLVFHPFLLTLLQMDGGTGAFVPEFLAAPFRDRARRHAETLERLIAADGSFPAIGRSLTYRCGVFQLLGHLALADDLPDRLRRGDVRDALDAVIRWTLEPPGTLDDEGWLRIGLRGHQPGLAEHYVSCGSGYMCLTAFLPLGLSASSSFWTEDGGAWTAVRLARGNDPGIDATPRGLQRCGPGRRNTLLHQWRAIRFRAGAWGHRGYA